MSDIQNKQIKIKGIAQEATPFGATKTIFTVDGKDGKDAKLYFFDKKKSGGTTTAQQNYDQLRPRIGDVLDIGFVKEDYNFISKKGANIGKEISGSRFRIANMELATGTGVNTTQAAQTAFEQSLQPAVPPMNRDNFASSKPDDEEINVSDIPF